MHRRLRHHASCLVGQWLRVARSDLERRSTALHTPVASRWCKSDGFGSDSLRDSFSWPVLIVRSDSRLVPIWAEQFGAHHLASHHIIQRHGLFTIIVLGEAVLSASLMTVVDTRTFDGERAAIAVGATIASFT
ncbi:MAG: low temperature requirement protein A [Thermomicrobiales bacterium]